MKLRNKSLKHLQFQIKIASNKKRKSLKTWQSPTKSVMKVKWNFSKRVNLFVQTPKKNLLQMAKMNLEMKEIDTSYKKLS